MQHRIQFWKAVSNYSITVCAIILIARMFLRKYFEAVMFPLLIIGVVALVIFIVSEVIKVILKRTQ